MAAKKKIVAPTGPTIPPLPLGILKSDCEYPKYSSKPTSADYHNKKVMLNVHLYYVEAFGWVVTTVHISNANRRIGQSAARAYAVDLEGKVVRVGNGPHVLKIVSVYVRQERWEALKPLVELYNNGCIEAHKIRDRISTRRAQGQVHRANGEYSWRWDS